MELRRASLVEPPEPLLDAPEVPVADPLARLVEHEPALDHITVIMVGDDVPLEILQEHKKLTLKYQNAMKMLGGVGKRSLGSLHIMEEMARSNLRAYERCHGLTESDNHLI